MPLYRLLLLCYFLLVALSFEASSQNRRTLSGNVRDAGTGEALIGATVYDTLRPASGTATNVYGYFSLSVKEVPTVVKVNFVGYRPAYLPVTNMVADTQVAVELQPLSMLTQEVEITTDRAEENVRHSSPGRIDLQINEIEKLPVLFGELDVVRALQLLPGVQSGAEGSSGLFVRGGTPDQTLTLLDEAPVYNTGHLFGFFSVFNADALQHVTLLKGGMPAEYGDRLAAVADFRMREGNNQKFKVRGGLGLLSSRLTAEGPIIKNKSSFLISGRRSYIDLISYPFEIDGNQGLPYYFYDINIKANYRFSEKDRLFLSGFLGKDRLKLNLLNGRIQTDSDWGNSTAALRWNHAYGSKVFSNVSLVYSQFFLNLVSSYDNITTGISSGIEDITLKNSFEYFPSQKHAIKTGFDYTFHTFTPRNTNATVSGSAGFSVETPYTERFAHEWAVYIQDEFDVTSRLSVHAGLRFVNYRHVGPFRRLTADGDTVLTENSETLESYGGPEPRLSARYQLTENSSIKAGYNYNRQFVHQVSLSGNALPFDFWIPASVLIKPQTGWQAAGGYFRNFRQNTYETSVEAYYRRMNDQLEYREGYAQGFSGELEYELVAGEGQSYGLEFLIRKTKGRLRGWAAYTWARTTRVFPDINNGEEFPFRYDRRHDLSLTASYDLNKHWSLGATFVYNTGAAITIPVRRYFIEGQIVNEYGSRNGFRMESYHRLDLAATWTPKPERKDWKSSWVFGVYNAYNRQNPFIYYIDSEGNASNNTLNLQAKKLYIFPILPSVTWNFAF